MSPPDLAPSPASPSPSPPPPAAPALPDPGVRIISSPTESDAQQRWRADREAVAARDVWMQDPSKVVMRKSSDGVVSAHPRTDQAQQPDPAATSQPGDQQQPQPQPQPLNSDGKIQLTKDIALSETELHDLLAHKAQTDSQKLSTPKPNEYQLKFNDDFVLPQGTEWKWDETSPLLTAVREFASANNMSQTTFSRLLQMHAASRIGEDMAFAEAKSKELAALGDSGDQRIRAVVTWMRSMVPAEHAAGLVRVLEAAPMASTIRAMESLIQRWTNQGAGGFNGAHREPHIPGKVSDEVYNSMTYAQKLDYASKFDQSRR
jgi:hypothetical protein